MFCSIGNSTFGSVKIHNEMHFQNSRLECFFCLFNFESFYPGQFWSDFLVFLLLLVAMRRRTRKANQKKFFLNPQGKESKSCQCQSPKMAKNTQVPIMLVQHRWWNLPTYASILLCSSLGFGSFLPVEEEKNWKLSFNSKKQGVSI